MEGQASIPGKYMIDFLEEDEKWMEQRRNAERQKYVEFFADVDWSEYTHDKMIERYGKEKIENEEKLKVKKQELTNVGKRLLEKQKNSSYDKFRKQFKDVFDNIDYKVI
jgi:hypothetical protein